MSDCDLDDDDYETYYCPHGESDCLYWDNCRFLGYCEDYPDCIGVCERNGDNSICRDCSVSDSCRDFSDDLEGGCANGGPY